jgi:hypothetical protein
MDCCRGRRKLLILHSIGVSWPGHSRHEQYLSLGIREICWHWKVQVALPNSALMGRILSEGTPAVIGAIF